MPLVWNRFNFPITSKEEAQIFIKEFKERASRNSSPTGCLNRNDKIKLLHSYSPNFLDESVYNINVNEPVVFPPDPSRRERLQEFDCIPSVGLEINLIKAVDSGHFSQVWRSRTPKGANVISKIFQSCLAPELPFWHKQRACLWDFTPEEEQAHREMWAYQTLANIQGLVIPHSYGFYEVRRQEILSS